MYMAAFLWLRSRRGHGAMGSSNGDEPLEPLEISLRRVPWKDPPFF